MPFNPFTIPVLLAALICGGLAVYAWQQRPRPGALEFALLLLAITIHCFGYAMELLNNQLGPILFWLRIEYLGIATEPSLWIALVLQYTNRSRWLTARNVALLGVVPLITLLLNYTNDLHSLYYADVFLDTSGPYPLLAIIRGPWYYVHSAYIITAFLAGSVWLVVQSWRAPRLYRMQNLLMVLAACVPLVTYALYILDIQPVEHLDTTPVAFAITGIIAAYGLFRYRLILIRPVARDVLFEYIQSGVLLLDGDGRLTDLNPSAESFLGLRAPLPIGKTLKEILPQLPASFDLDQKMEERVFEWHYEPYDLEVRITPLQVKGQQRIGYVILLNDITQLKQVQRIERQFLEQQSVMAVLEEREHLASDLHDGVGQVLGYVSMQAQVAREMLQNNQVQIARSALDNLVEVSQDAHADLRTFILGVRSGEVSGEGFFETLEKYIDQFSRHYDLRIALHRPEEAGACDLTMEAQTQLLSIIQEALNNTRKHARATQVEITFDYQPEEVRVKIQDNGRGFDAQANQAQHESGEGHFGLKIMDDRARVAGGRLTIQSAPGQGCAVLVSLPRKQAKATRSLLAELRVLIVDDLPLFRNGLRYLLQSRNIQVIGEAGDGAEGVRLAAELRPDVILMDFHMPGMDGLQAAQAVKKQWPEIKILILTVDRADGMLLDAIRAGADGYLPKDMEAGRLFEILENLMRGEPAFASDIAARTLVNLARQQGQNLAERFPMLTQRQREILMLLEADLTNREIGERLFLSEAAIKYHVGQIFETMGVKSRQEAVQKMRSR